MIAKSLLPVSRVPNRLPLVYLGRSSNLRPRVLLHPASRAQQPFPRPQCSLRAPRTLSRITVQGTLHLLRRTATPLSHIATAMKRACEALQLTTLRLQWAWSNPRRRQTLKSKTATRRTKCQSERPRGRSPLTVSSRFAPCDPFGDLLSVILSRSKMLPPEQQTKTRAVPVQAAAASSVRKIATACPLMKAVVPTMISFNYQECP